MGNSKEELADCLPDHVIVLQLFQQTDLPDRSARYAFVFGFQSDLLEGDDSVRVDIPGFVYDTIGTYVEPKMQEIDGMYGKTSG